MPRPIRTLLSGGFALLAVGSALLVASCGGSPRASDAVAEPVATVRFADEAGPTALVVDEDGRLLVGERTTGRVRAVVDGQPDAVPVAEVAVRRDGQRGLLGLAVLDGRLFACWVRAEDGRIVVGELTRDPTGYRDPPAERLVWEGPRSSDLANGGHLDVWDGRLVVGIGDLEDRETASDPTSPNGKLLALDPDGPADQQPEVLSSGWNNPFAFTVAGDVVWVADNSPGDEPERLGRGDRPDGPRIELDGERAPSALVPIGGGQLGLCGFLTGELVVVEVDGAAPLVGSTVAATGCRTGAVLLPDGSVAVSDGEVVRIVEGL